MAVPIVATCVTIAVGYQVVHHQRSEFREQIHVGMTKAEIVQRVGAPAIQVESGGRLSRWGNEGARPVKAETWVYYVFPRSQHRFVLTFADDTLANIEHHQN